jgi:hypothetical protein
MDVERGTRFPPISVLASDGTRASLTSIYAAQDVDVRIDYDQSDIHVVGVAHANDPDPDPGGGDPSPPGINDAEIHLAEIQHRNSPRQPVKTWCERLGLEILCTQYQVYGIVFDDFYENRSGSIEQSTMGMMWRQSDRGAFALFYKNETLRADERVYFKAVVHELGHALNLDHKDSDGETDIMHHQNGTRHAGELRFLSARAIDHLKRHPPNCRWPGMSAFGSKHSEHAYSVVPSPDSSRCE